MTHFVSTGLAGSKSKSTFVLLASLGALLGAGAASAAIPDTSAPSIVVRYSDQSLGTSSGMTELYQRIVSASKRVCPEESVRDLASEQRVLECRKLAVSRAIQQIHNSQFAEAYGTRSKNG